MLDRDRPAKLEHVVDTIRPFDPVEPALRGRHYHAEITHRSFPCSSIDTGELIGMVNVALKSAAVSVSDLYCCKNIDNLTDDAATQALPWCPPQAATPRARAQPEPDGWRARHFRLLSQSLGAQSTAGHGGHTATSGGG